MVSSPLLLTFSYLLCAFALLLALSSARRLRRSRAELVAERRRADLVMRATQSGIIDWDVAGNKVTYSERFKEILGFPPNVDLSDRTQYFASVHPDDRETAREAFVAHLREGRETLHPQIEYRLRRADQGYTWVRATGLSLRDEGGKAVRYIASVSDISARRAQEEAIQDQIKLTRDLIDANPSSIFIKDPQLRYLHVNPEWEKMTGVTAQEAVGKTVVEVIGGEGAALSDTQDRELLQRATGTSTIEYQSERSGELRHFVLSKSVLHRSDGSVRALVGTSMDVTAQKRHEQALRDQVELTRDLIHFVPNPLFHKDENFRFVNVNPAWEKMSGISAEKAIGGLVQEVYPPQFAAAFEQQDRELLAAPDGMNTMEIAIPGRKRTRHYILSKALLRRDDGSLRGMVGSCTEITELKRIEAELRRSREEAMQAAQAKAAFLAAMSHEIRTPLNGVLGMAGLLADTRLSAEQREYVDTIRVSGDALLSVINDILDFSKIESGRMELEQEPFEPMRAVEESLEILGEQARGKRIELIAEVDDSVPLWMRGDLARLRQVLVNLVGNAVKFTERGEVVVRLRAGPGGALAFAVSDTGIGIPRERLETLFQPFTQADVSTTRKYGGTGLGLAISRRLVELMGGTLRGESTPGAGSTFAFDVNAAACEAPPRAAPPADLSLDLSGRRILVVDDNATNLRIVRRQLERWGAVPVAVATPVAALELATQDRSLDAALLDYHMPGMDGVMLARRIKAVAKSLPLVLLSSSMYRRAEEAEAGLFVQQLLKPVRQQHLREALAAALAGPGSKPAKPRRAGRKPAAAPGGLRVLVVDDVEVNRRLAQALLRKLGHSSDAAASGLEGVEMAGAGNHDVVLMDVQMPDIDGMEAMRRIRERLGTAAPRMVAMTANAMPGDRERCLAAGMDGYLAKPIDPRALAEEIACAGPGGALLDDARLKALLEYDDADRSMLRAIVDVFLRDAAKYIESAGQAHARTDLVEVARSAHALKGASSNAGAKALSEIAGRIEALAREGAAGGLGLLLKTLASAYEQTAAALATLKRR